jgi:hypothetical protein
LQKASGSAGALRPAYVMLLCEVWGKKENK